MVRNQKHIDHQELRRRKRERIIIVMTIVVIFVLTLLENRIFQKEAIVPVSNNILVFGLININIILILLLVFLIVRNVVKLIFERRHGVLGSKLRTKLWPLSSVYPLSRRQFFFWLQSIFFPTV
jgi:two-component system nitrogen regulation sensor histidine kinase NtrY